MPNTYRPQLGATMGGCALQTELVEVQRPPACHLLSQLTANAIAWAREAGKIALHYFKNVSVDYKPDNTVLTQADLEIEDFLVDQIRRTYPDHALLGEEGARLLHPAANKRNESGITPPAYTWAIDPLVHSLA